VRELSIVALSLLPLSSALAQPAAEQPPAGQGGGDAGAPPSGGGGEGGAPPEQGGAPPEPAKPEPTKPEPPKEEPKKPEPPPAVPEPPKETPHKGSFEFGSYGRVIAAVNGEGGPGRDADIVAHGSRMDEDNYMEAELRREDDWDKTGIHTNVVLTLALASPVFHWSGEFELNAAIRNMYLEARDIGVKGLTAWAGSRMVRGDDIYVLDWWPLDNLNLLGAGVSYAHEVGTSGQLVVGATQPNVPFFKQTVERPAPLDQYGSVAIPLLDRQKLIGALRLQHHQKFGPKDKPSPGLKAVLYGEGYALPEGQYEPEPGAELEQLPSDGGLVVGAQGGFFTGERDTHVNLFLRYATGLAAYGEMASPASSAWTRPPTARTSSPSPSAPTGRQAPSDCSQAPTCGASATRAPLNYEDVDELMVAVRPHLFFGESGGIAVEGSYQLAQRGVQAVVGRIPSNLGTPTGPLTAGLFRFGIVPFLSPAGRGDYVPPAAAADLHAHRPRRGRRALYPEGRRLRAASTSTTSGSARSGGSTRELRG
jgi:hypothetical protein